LTVCLLPFVACWYLALGQAAVAARFGKASAARRYRVPVLRAMERRLGRRRSWLPQTSSVELSVAFSAALLAVYLVQALFTPRRPLAHSRDSSSGAVLFVFAMLVFYRCHSPFRRARPLRVTLLSTVLTGVAAGGLSSVRSRPRYKVAGLIALAYAGYVFRGLASDNLWDYLFDVPLVVAAMVVVARGWRTVVALPWRSLFPRRFTIGALAFAGSFLLFAVVLSRVNPAAFATDFTVEDGFIEWVTTITLFAAFCVSAHRFVTARRNFGLRGRFTLLLLVTMFLFGAGEEISWGQRIFGIETPRILAENNAQKEMNLHNLTFDFGGKTYKVNRLIFGRGIAIVLILYLFVLAPLYRRHAGFRRLVDVWAVPVPTALQIAAYVVVAAVVEGLIDSPKRGEMTEFAGAIVILLNIAFPFTARSTRRASDARTTHVVVTGTGIPSASTPDCNCALSQVQVHP
jgi:hypothetical protein